MKVKTLMGLPEADASLPFAMIAEARDNVFIFTGLAGGTGKSPKPDLLVVNEKESKAILSSLESSLTVVSPKYFHEFMERAWESAPPEEFVELKALLPPPESKELPEYDVQMAIATAPLMNPETGVFFQLSQHNYQQGIAAIYMAFQNATDTQKKIIDAAVDVTSDMAIDTHKARIWQLAMEVTGLIASTNGNELVSKVALQNATAFSMGLSGSEIPFVRAWVNQQLASAVAMARMIEKAKVHDQ